MNQVKSGLMRVYQRSHLGCESLRHLNVFNFRRKPSAWRVPLTHPVVVERPKPAAFYGVYKPYGFVENGVPPDIIYGPTHISKILNASRVLSANFGYKAHVLVLGANGIAMLL